ncbi:hypothetical protein FQR65_LT01798 [Abscondita terminalis]|nr:hypothetical protein FQR65_LT01798 [Abscondita terminalis]
MCVKLLILIALVAHTLEARVVIEARNSDGEIRAESSTTTEAATTTTEIETTTGEIDATTVVIETTTAGSSKVTMLSLFIVVASIAHFAL